MDTTAYIVGKLAGALLRAEFWLIVALAGLLAALCSGRRRWALGLAGGVLAGLLALAVLPLGDVLLAPLERRHPVGPSLGVVDGIIVLGGGEDASASAHWGEVELNEAGERYTAALALARRHPRARLLFSGGGGALRDLAAGRGPTTAEAAVAAAFFAEHGVAWERLLLEGASRNTAENARLSRALARPAAGETWVLVTSAFHMERALRHFAAAGWPALVPWPVDHRTTSFAAALGFDLPRNLALLNTAVKEYVALLALRGLPR